MIVVNHLPEAFALLFITAGIAMIIVALAGKVVFKDIEFGTDKFKARIAFGFIGLLLIWFSLSPHISTKCDLLLAHRPDPTVVVRDHYEGIRGRAYYAAWNRLPQKVQNDPKIHPNGYPSFESWFESINPIRVKDLQIINCQDDNNVRLKVTYYSESTSQTFSLVYQLKWNDQKSYWEFVGITPI